ncbi:TRAP transporter substrate-binding protein [Oceanobacillus longus]|uniref:TRAP transporter substrate-binding protein n=1 Tax=Oceanobacillus longus TaxID=930120 RepID=A0ABV8GZG8_9BACI
MKHTKLFFLIITLSMVFVVAACGQDQESGATESEDGTTLTLNHWLSSNHYIADAIVEWADIVEDKTEGRVKVEVYSDGALGSQLQAHEDIAGGVYDIGEITVSTMEDTSIFVHSIGNLPFAFDNIDTSFDVMGDYLDKYGEEIYEENNLVYMSNSTSFNYALHSRTPIRNIDDAKGKIINASANSMASVFKEWGSTRESMAFSELYQAIQRGTIDALWVPAPAAYDTNFYEVAPYITKFNGPAYNFQAAFVMSPSAFEGLPDDLKPLFEDELFPLLGEMHKESYPKEEEVWSTIDELLADSEGEVIELTAEEEAEFQKGAKPVWDEWVEEANDKGYPGDEMMDDFRKLLEEEGVEIPF